MAYITCAVRILYRAHLASRSDHPSRFQFFEAWLLIYFSSGIYANLLSCVLHPAVLGVGSSGCLCGLIGGWLSFLLITWNQTMPNDVKMRNAQTTSILISIVLVVVFSFMPLMDLAAHIGGLIMGVG
ncbi:Rhomboid-like protease 3, partial [Durusdinium trenchii]